MPATAQRKEISLAKSQVKSGRNLEQAESSMRNLLKDSTNLTNKKIWLTLFDAISKQYEQGNEQLYLKKQYDTARIFNNTLKMFEVLEAFDTIDAMADANGRVKPEYRDKHADMLNAFRPNLFNGGTFFIRKQRYEDGYKFLDAYIKCADLPLFAKFDYMNRDKQLPQAAYWTTYCGYKLQDAEKSLAHSTLALKDSVHKVLLLQYLAEIYKLKNDTAGYVFALKEGFGIRPSFPYFFPRLMEHYASQGLHKEALAFADEALKLDSTSHLFQFAKSTALFNLGRYDDCITICGSLLAEGDTLPDIYLNIGLAYYNKAVKIDKNVRLNKRQRGDMQELYKKAMPYLEKYRNLKPEDKSHWALPLYTIYLKLNMGAKFDEIDKIV